MNALIHQQTGANQEPTGRLAQAVKLACHAALSFRADDLLLVDPQRLRLALETALEGSAGRVRVAGSLDRRLVFIERHDGRWTVADLSGQPHQTRNWPHWASGHLEIDDLESWLSLATLDEDAVYRLTRPGVLLAALYHPEHFPLPRFPLGISDVARAARSTLTGGSG
jgi:hypothetical protein